MNKASTNELIAQLTSRADELLNSKGTEYTNDKDNLSNFKRLQEMGFDITPATVAWVYGSKHLESVLKYVKKNTLEVGTEPALDRFADLINYLRLVYCCLVEADRQRKSDNEARTLPFRPTLRTKSPHQWFSTLTFKLL